MRRHLPVSILLLLAAWCGAALAADSATPSTSLEGLAGYKSAVDTTWDRLHEDVWSNDWFGYAAASASWGLNYGVRAAGLFEYRLDVGEEAQGEAIPELRELYGKLRLGKLDLFAGQQIVSWATTDLFSPLDQLNPYDYRRTLDRELSFYRLGTFMIRPVLYLDPVQIEAVYIPVFTPPRYRIVGSDYALVGHDFPIGELINDLRQSDRWRALETALGAWVPEWRQDLRDFLSDPDYYSAHTDLPDQDLTAPEGAARVRYTSPFIDVTAAYYALWDDLPTLHVNPALRELSRWSEQTGPDAAILPPGDVFSTTTLSDPFTLTHHRVQSAGLGLATSVFDIGLHGEGLMAFDRYTYRDDLSAVRRNQASWALNVDYTFPADVFAEGWLLQSYLFDREEDFLQRAWTSMGGLVLRKSFCDEKLALELLSLVDFTYQRDRDWRRFDLTAGGWTVQPLATYSVTDPFKLSVGANLFGGRDETLMGSLEGLNQVFVLARYGF